MSDLLNLSLLHVCQREFIVELSFVSFIYGSSAVTTTNEAQKALELLRENKNKFDLVISDVDMPDMDGFKLLELVGLEMDLPVISKSIYLFLIFSLFLIIIFVIFCLMTILQE